jgi:hypothetical protein
MGPMSIIYGHTSVKNLIPSGSTQMLQFKSSKYDSPSTMDFLQLHSPSPFGGASDEPTWISPPSHKLTLFP